jgi:hypothetical protein
MNKVLAPDPMPTRHCLSARVLPTAAVVVCLLNLGVTSVQNTNTCTPPSLAAVNRNQGITDAIVSASNVNALYLCPSFAPYYHKGATEQRKHCASTILVKLSKPC